MTFKPNQTVLRAFVLHEVRNERPIEEAYTNFRKMVGTDAMEYTEFDYWFYRFYNGDHDLNHDRSLDPKTHTFSELPTDIIEEFMSYLKLSDRLHLRKVSTHLRDINDKRSSNCDKIDMNFYGTQVAILFDNKRVEYNDLDDGCMIRDYLENTNKKIWFKGNNFWKMAADDMLFVLKNKKLQLKKLLIKFNLSCENDKRKQMAVKFLQYLKTSFESLPHKLQVKEIQLSGCDQKGALFFLPYIKPGTLEIIRLNGRTEENGEMWMKIEQYKQEIDFRTEDLNFVPVEYLCHLCGQNYVAKIK